MIRALLLILVPQKAWERIVTGGWGLGLVFLISVVPFILFAGLLEGLAMTNLGASQNAVGRISRVSQEVLIRFQLLQVGMTCLSILLGGKLIQWICGGFHFSAAFSPCLVLAAYGVTPILWARVLDGVPGIQTWICFGIGAVGVFYVMYHGVAFVLKPDASVGFGLYLVCALALVFVTGLAHFVAHTWLSSRLGSNPDLSMLWIASGGMLT